MATWWASCTCGVPGTSMAITRLAQSASGFGAGPVIAHASAPTSRAASAARRRLGLRPDVDSRNTTSPSLACPATCLATASSNP